MSNTPPKKTKPKNPPILRTQKFQPSPNNQRHGGNNRRGGNGNNRGGNGRGRQQPPVPPSPWIEHPADLTPSPHPTASFVEYLRWMRAYDADDDYKDITKLQLLQSAQEDVNFIARLQVLNARTKSIVGASGHCFNAICPWRIRVGGHRGPESMLLPAFDSLGIPYIPSSTLRGIARKQALHHFLQSDDLKDLSVEDKQKAAEKRVASYFGSLKEDESEREGKVIFLDAYPIPPLRAKKFSGLSLDIANSLWTWTENKPQYKPNPNTYLSLERVAFRVGIRRNNRCSESAFNSIKAWLKLGLTQGIGSQVNAGYGAIKFKNFEAVDNNFLDLDFVLEGQLIHGAHYFKNLKSPYERDKSGKLKTNKKGLLKPATAGNAEIRPSAFKSLMRYWFRVIALGVLAADRVRLWEHTIFGSIDLKKQGWLKVSISSRVDPDFPETSTSKDEPGTQTGTLHLGYSTEAPSQKQEDVANLLTNLTWLMFRLGGVGQGARRPCHQRTSNPWWRGSTLIPRESSDFWALPFDFDLQEFQQIFQERLTSFYKYLSKVTETPTSNLIDSADVPTVTDWIESLDKHAIIAVCQGKNHAQKVYALAILHHPNLKLRNDDGELEYDKNLCGTHTTKPVTSSPVWIADLDECQVVTVFGVTSDPRKQFLEQLQQNGDYYQIFPLNQQIN